MSCGKCGNGLGHEFLGDGPGGKGSRFEYSVTPWNLFQKVIKVRQI